MTVSTTSNRIVYTGNGSTTAFAFPYKFIATADLKVYVGGVLQSSGYTVGTPSDTGANVTFSAAPANSATIIILSDPARLQGTSLPSTGPFPAKSVETMADKLTLLVQRLYDLASRSLTLNDADATTVSTTLPTPAASQIIGWDSTGSSLQNVPLSSLATSIAYGTARSDIFTGDGTTKTFTLSANPGAQANLDVAIAGVTQLPVTDYTWTTGTSLIFASAPPLGAKILARYMQGLAQGTSDSGSAAFIQFGTGAVQRTAQDKMRETVSAADFGMSTSASAAANQAALVAALAASDSVFIPAGTFSITGPIDVSNKRIFGRGIYRTVLQLSGTNTATTLFYNNKTSAASWGSGGSLELRDISLRGNWDGSASLADQSWDNTAALLKLGASAGVRLVDVSLLYAFGHNASFYRLGYATFTRVKVTAARKNGLHFEAPSGSDSITSTWIENCDLNSNRGVGNIYVKNGVGLWVNGCVFEDSLSGVYLDGADNRNVTIINNHAETCTNGLLHYVGSGQKTVLSNNFGDAQITRTNPTFQTLFAQSNQGMFNGIEEGFGPIYQDTVLNANLESGDGTSTYANKKIGWFGTANYLDVVGRLSWRTNNNNNASVPMAQISAVQKGNVNQNFGQLVFSTGNNGLVDRFIINESGAFYPNADNTYSFGASSNRLSVIYAGTGTINTSDAREKQDDRPLSEKEHAVAVKIKGLIKAFRFKDAVAAKGDQARIHFGVYAQEVHAAFESEGLNADDYALFCRDQWAEEPEVIKPVLDDDGKPTGDTYVAQPYKAAGDRYGIRYDELLAFVIASL